MMFKNFIFLHSIYSNMVKSTNIFKMLVFIILMACECMNILKNFSDDDIR
jgi:hypothetical protein